MPITPPPLDNRRFADLRDEALARIPVHTPEWSNFNASDPGVTLVEVFAFLTESLLYRANQIPERNRQNPQSGRKQRRTGRVHPQRLRGGRNTGKYVASLHPGGLWRAQR